MTKELEARARELREAAEALMARWPTDQHTGSPLKNEADALRAALQASPAEPVPQPNTIAAGQREAVARIVAWIGDDPDHDPMPLDVNASGATIGDLRAILAIQSPGAVDEREKLAAMLDAQSNRARSERNEYPSGTEDWFRLDHERAIYDDCASAIRDGVRS
jgi:hypothetical protein